MPLRVWPSRGQDARVFDSGRNTFILTDGTLLAGSIGARSPGWSRGFEELRVHTEPSSVRDTCAGRDDKVTHFVVRASLARERATPCEGRAQARSLAFGVTRKNPDAGDECS